MPELCTVFLYSSTSVNDSQLTNISEEDDYGNKTKQRYFTGSINVICVIIA